MDDPGLAKTTLWQPSTGADLVLTKYLHDKYVHVFHVYIHPCLRVATSSCEYPEVSTCFCGGTLFEGQPPGSCEKGSEWQQALSIFSTAPAMGIQLDAWHRMVGHPTSGGE